MIEREEKSPRLCIDYRRLNKITQDEPAVLTRIDENLKDLGRASIYSLIDLYTAFATPDGAIYEFNVLLFGLNNAPTTFQRFMANDVLVGCLHDFCKVYLDDILIYMQCQP